MSRTTTKDEWLVSLRQLTAIRAFWKLGDTRTLWWRMATHLRERGYTNALNRPIRDFLDEYRAARAHPPTQETDADA